MEKLLKKKYILVLSIMLISSLIAFLLFIPSDGTKSYANTDVIKWDGVTISTEFSSGNGTKDNPYLIASGNDLMYFKNVIEGDTYDAYKSLYYKLSSDIDLDNIDIDSIGSIDKPFMGHFDGDGHTIYNISFNDLDEESKFYGLFYSLEEAEISKLSLNTINIDPSIDNYNIGIISSNMNKTSISNLLIENINIKLVNTTYNENSHVALLSNNINESNLDSIYIHGIVVSKYSENINKIANTILATDINKVYTKLDSGDLYITDIPDYGNDADLPSTYFDNLSDILTNFICDGYTYEIVEDELKFSKIEEFEEIPLIIERVKKSPVRASAQIPLHANGIEGDTIYINDLDSDFNYYKGLNYAEIAGTTAIPNGNDRNLYNSNNMVQVYVKYSGKDYYNSNIVGYVSPSEQVSEFIYYKYYIIKNGYVEFDLIDNPYAQRPTGRAFNGWITDYDGAIVSFDSDMYVRRVKIPASNTDTIHITFNATWTVSTEVTLGNSYDESNLKSTGMVRVAPTSSYTNVYDTPGTLYDLAGTVNNGARFPNNGNTNYYNKHGVRVNNQTCNVEPGDSNCPYYTVYTLTNNSTGHSCYYLDDTNTMASYTVPAPSTCDFANSIFHCGDNISGYFKFVHVDRGTVYDGRYYRPTGLQETGASCTANSGCDTYELLQFDEDNKLTVDNYTTIYYFVTRDTNIAKLGNNSINGFTNSKPVTVTGIDGSTNNSGRQINVQNNSINANNDLRIEFATLYTNRTTGGSNNFGRGNTTKAVPSNETTKRIIGNWYNVKIGRGLPANNYMSAISAAAGNTTTSTTLKKYTFIVESGYYNSLGGGAITRDGSGSSLTGNNYYKGISIYGCDYDRIDGQNAKLRVYYTVAAVWDSYARVSSSSNTSTTFSDAYVKSGTLGMMDNTGASGIYVTGLYYGQSYAPATVTIEGGIIKQVNGGPSPKSDASNYNTVGIYMKGGTVDFLFGGAATSTTYGNRVLSVTGGNVNYSVYGGSNGVDGTDGDGKLDSETFVYVGGSAHIGTGSNTIPFGSQRGSVFGAGNGNANYDSIGSVKNSTVIIGPTAQIDNNVFGGGNYGAVGTSSGATSCSTKIKMLGGLVSGSVYGGGNNSGAGVTADTRTRVSNTLRTQLINQGYTCTGRNNNYTCTRDATTASIEITTEGGTVSGSIYGGSCTKGVVAGNTKLNINAGSVTNSVYGGGEGGYRNTNNPGTYVSGNVEVNIGNSSGGPTISGSVYGGSAYGTVNGWQQNESANNNTTKVNINNGTITGSVFGGGKGGTFGNTNYTPNEYGNITVTVNNGSMGNVYGGNDAAGSPSNKDLVYLKGGTIANAFGGGNQTGQPSTEIYLQGSTITGNLYGGSNQSGTVTTTKVVVESGSVTDIYGGNNLGGTVGTTNVTISGVNISGTIYGGGNEATTTTTNVTITNGTLNDVYGGGNKASANVTNVTMNNGTVDEMYGGGYSAGVTTSTNVIINGGTINDLYGGSNTSGDIPNSYVTVNSTAGDPDNNGINNIFGGNNTAGLTSTSHVEIKGGFNGNVYGGGQRAGVTTTHVTVTGGNTDSVYGGSYIQGDVTTSNVTIGNSTGNILTITDVYGGNNLGGKTTTTNITVTRSNISNLYGGGNQAPVGTTNLTIGNGTIGNLYGGGNAAVVENNTYLDIDNTVVTTNVYGGGNQGAVLGDTEVHVTSATVSGSVYAGGNGSTAIVHGNTSITVDGTTTVGDANSEFPDGSVFGGGNAATTGVDESSHSVATVNIVGGEIFGNVYGGANSSIVYGATIVNIGTEAVNISGLNESDLKIHGTIFGGGESNADGNSSFDSSFISVYDSIDINIDGTNYKEHGKAFTINGSIFGSGNASYSMGESTIYIKKLGTYERPNKNISIQRTDVLTLDNSAIELEGLEDSTAEIKDYKFSFNQVDKLYLKNNSVVLAQSNNNYLGEFYSGYDDPNTGNFVLSQVTITDEGAVTLNNPLADNRLYSLVGNNFDIKKLLGTGDTSYGEVYGMTFYGMYETGTVPKYGIYSKAKTGLDGNNDLQSMVLSDKIFGGSYVAGLHKVDHDIEVDGFYTNYPQNNDTRLKTAYIDPGPIGTNGYVWRVGEQVVNYNVALVISQYSSFGVASLPLEFNTDADTTFELIKFDAGTLKQDISIVDPSQVPSIAANEDDANHILGLTMKSETSEWTSYESSKFFSRDGGDYDGSKYYVTDSSGSMPNLMFYLQHAKNITKLEDNLGYATIYMRSTRKTNYYDYEFKDIAIKVSLTVSLGADKTSYDAAISYGVKYELPSITSVNITNKSQFTAYYSLYSEVDDVDLFYGVNYSFYHVLVTDYALPVGTEITMLDYGANFMNSVNNPDIYYLYIDQTRHNAMETELQNNGEVTIRLNEFRSMSSTTLTNMYNEHDAIDKYYDSDEGRTIEEFIFIFDFKKTTATGTHTGHNMLFELRGGVQNSTYIEVLFQRMNFMKYNLYDASNSLLEQTVTDLSPNLYYNTPSKFSYTTKVGYNKTESQVPIVDTNYEASSMGLNVTLYDSSGSIVTSSLLSGSSIKVGDSYYFADYDGVFRIKLAGKVSNLTKPVEFLTDESLHTGNYTMKFQLFASSDGKHVADNQIGDEDTYPLSLLGADNAIRVTTEDKTKVVNGETQYNELGTHINTYTVYYTSVLENPNIRLSIYKRNLQTDVDTTYTEVPLSYLFEATSTYTDPNNVPGLSKVGYESLLTNNPQSSQEFSFTFKDSLTSGTYKLVFGLYNDNDLVESDIEYIIITKPTL